MIVGHLPVHAGVAVETLAEIFVEEVSLVLQQEGFSEGFLLQIALLPGGVAGIVDTAEDIHPAGAVVRVQGSGRIVPPVPAQRLGILGVQVESEAVSQAADGADAHDALYSCIVLGTGVCDYLDALDFIALQAVQLTAVRHFPAVDINQWRALAYHLQAVLPFNHARRLCQYVIGGPGIFQHRAPYSGLQALAGQAGLRHYYRNGGSLQHGRVFNEGYYRAVHRCQVQRLIPEDGNHHDAIGFLGDYIE